MIETALLSRPVSTPARPVADGRAGDLFALGRSAAAASRAASGGRVVFARTRQLLATGAWRGPRDAADAYLEEEDLAAVGGLIAAAEAGVRTVLASSADVARAAQAAGLRVLMRVGYRAGEEDTARLERLEAVAVLAREGVVDGVIPTPQAEALGLDTLRFFALCRLHAGAPHVLSDFARLGHRLSQMALGFGADELFGPIVPERALRLGDNANNPAMTRKEAATIVRGAGLTPVERLSGGLLEECVS